MINFKLPYYLFLHCMPFHFFIFEIIILTSLHFFFHYKFSHIHFPVLQICGLFFSTNCYCRHTCIFMYHPKYSMFSPYNVTCMYIYRANNLALDSQLVFWSRWKLLLPLAVSSVLCVGLRRLGLAHPPVQVGVILVQLTLSHCREFTDVSSDVTRCHNLAVSYFSLFPPLSFSPMYMLIYDCV